MTLLSTTVRSASGAGAGGWLRDLPGTGSELLSTEEIRYSLRLLLGLPIPGLRTTPECTVCAKPHAADGTQRLFHCSTSAGNWTLRHNRIRDELARHLRRWHIPDVQVEPYGFFEGSRLRPDIVVRHHRTGKQYVIDVKVESPLRAHLLARAACQSGYAAANAEAGKRAKYRDAIGDHNDFQFAPFTIEGFGRLDQAAQDFNTETTGHLEHKADAQTLVRVDLNRELWRGTARLAIHAMRKDNHVRTMFPIESSLLLHSGVS